MIQKTWVELDTPVMVKMVDDDESPAAPAGILKIVHHTGIDENHPVPFIEIIYAYGYINSAGRFIQLEKQTHTDFLSDITAPDDSGDLVAEAVPMDLGGAAVEPAPRALTAMNPVSRVPEKVGSWFTDMMTPTRDQPSRRFGDFRLRDLYEYLMDKYQIAGTIIEG